MLDEDLRRVITQKRVVTYALLPDLQPYEPMFSMLSHFVLKESSNFCSRAFCLRGRLGDIHRAKIILTKVRSVRSVLRNLKIWIEDKDLQDARLKKDILDVVDVQ